MAIEQLMLIAAALLGLSVLASKASGLLGVPALVLFLAIGMLAGSEGLGGIYFDDAQLAQSIAVVAFAFILFSGGLDTSWREVRPVLKQGLALATIGVLVTAAAVGMFAVVVLGFSLLEGFLLGAVISSTDAAAVFALLRTRDVRLSGSLEPLIELESGSNDPMAVFLTMGILSLITAPGASAFSLLPMFVLQMSLGALLGFAIGRAAVIVMNRLRLQADGLYVIVTITVALVAYGAPTAIGGNGFLAVYVAGVVMGNHDFIHKRSLSRFHDGLAWLMQIAMFLTLGLLVFPSRLIPLAGVALLASAFLIFVARPAAVFLSLFWARMQVRELLLVSWIGLRGAAPIMLATFPLLASVPQASTIFNLVFFVVLTSVLIQGTTVSLVANWLGLNAPQPKRPPSPVVLTAVKAKQVDIRISETSSAAGKQIVDLRLPEGALVILIARDGGHIVPTGSTVIEAGDVLTLLASDEDLDNARAKLLNPKTQG